MHTDNSRIWPYVIAALAVFLIYRRLRRNFGRQPVRPVRMYFRIALLLVLAASLIPAAVQNAQWLFAALLAGSVGIGLGIYGAQRTRYQTVDGRLYYLPHTYTGIAVSLLVVGRLMYRMISGYVHGQTPDAFFAASPSQGLAPSSMVRSPVTAALLFVLIGYYVCYYSAVLWKSKRITPQDVEAAHAAS